MRIETGSEYIVSEQAICCGYSRQIGVYAVAAVANALAAAGAEEIGIGVQIHIPTYGYQSRIHGLEKSVRKICKEKGFTLLEVKTGKNPSLRFAQVVANGVAVVKKTGEESRPKAGQALVLLKWLGMEGMLRITEEKEAPLKERFSPGFFAQIRSYESQVFSVEEVRQAREAGAIYLRQITEGGILAELYRLAQEEQVGLDLDLKKMSLLQETVEVCEQFHLNPYQMTSTGTFLAVTEDGSAFARKMEEAGIPVSVIGYLTDNHDKIIRNGEEVRYIDRPAPDAVYEIFAESQEK